MALTSNKPSNKEQTTAKQSVDTLRKISAIATKGTTMQFEVEGKSLSIPTKAVKLLEKVLDQMAKGNTVKVTSVETALTTQQAANMLNVSRPHLVKLLEAGKIPHQKVGSHRKVFLEDIQKYDQNLREIRKKNLDLLAKEAQEMKLGYE